MGPLVFPVKKNSPVLLAMTETRRILSPRKFLELLSRIFNALIKLANILVEKTLRVIFSVIVI